MGRRQLDGQQQREEKLGLAGARLTRDLGDIARGDAAPERGIELRVQGADGGPPGGELGVVVTELAAQVVDGGCSHRSGELRLLLRLYIGGVSEG